MIILNQLRNPHSDQIGIKSWAFLLDLRKLLRSKAKMGFLMPLPSFELGMHRQELGLRADVVYLVAWRVMVCLIFASQKA